MQSEIKLSRVVQTRKFERESTMTPVDRRTIHILHVVSGMVRGGAETWLMHVLRHIDRDRLRMDFLVHTTDPCAYDEEIRALGSQIIPCPLHRWNLWSYATNFKQILHEYGPYDVVHSHLHHFSGYILRLARQAGVPCRIAHSHNDTSAQKAKTGLYRSLYYNITKRWISQNATMGLGCSYQATTDLFGSAWKTDPRWQVFYCGIDPTPFQQSVDAAVVRAEFKIPEDAFVIGHVGKFDQQKNHQFLVDIAVECVQREPKMRLLLVGDGLLRPEIEAKVQKVGLVDHVIFAGVRPDVPQLMGSVMDVFLLPSLHEGLPLVLLEAQAAGLPCLFSDVITEEVKVVKPLMRQLSLSKSASIWAEAILAMQQVKSENNQAKAIMQIQQSPFNIQAGCKELEKLYLEKSTYAIQNKP
jgi:glycosyltransferase involved in cell wall biosynthesis